MRDTAKAFRDIGLVCRAGLDIAAITPILCRLIRQYIGAAAVAIFWMDDRGLPVGFHHEDSPPDARDLFANEFEALFLGPSEINVAQLASAKNKERAGLLFSPPESYWKSNTFNLLVRPSGHHHCIDLRVDQDRCARIVVLAFREQGQPFTISDVERLGYLEPALRSALKESQADVWLPNGSAGHLMIESNSLTIRYLDARAQNLLRETALVGQQISSTAPLITVPRFVAELCERAKQTGTACQSISIPSGRLEAEVSTLAEMNNTASTMFMVRLQYRRPASLMALDQVLDCKLSPTQKLLVLEAIRGTRRAEAAATHGLSVEALKKHLSAIYTELDVHGWDEIGKRLLDTGVKTFPGTNQQALNQF